MAGTASEADVGAHLVEKIVGGDQQAEIEMIDRYNRGLYAVIFAKSKDKEIAQEVVQDTWVVVIEKIRRNDLRDANKLAQFIIQIGKNQLIMRYRANAKQVKRFTVVEQEFTSNELSPMQSAENDQLKKAIIELFEQLPTQRDRDLLSRYYLTGDSKSSLCNEYSLTEVHFDRVIYRARERFKSLWRKSQNEKYN